MTFKRVGRAKVWLHQLSQGRLMVEFRWKTEGSRVAGSVTFWPPSVMLLLVIGVAIAITALLTGKVSEQEKNYQAKQAAYEEMVSKRAAAQANRRVH